MPVDKRPSGLDNLITEINGNEILVVDNGTVVGKMAISTIKSIFSKADIGLSNVDNTADSQKPVSGPQAAVLSGKSAIGHGHVISEVTGLATALSGKADTTHGHAITDVTNLTEALNSKAGVDHNHDFNDITGLAGAVTTEVSALVPDLVVAAVGSQLASKADVNHTHLSSDITDLSTTINSAIASAIPNIDASNIQNSIYVAELQW